MEASLVLQSHNGSTMPLQTVYASNGNMTDQPVLDQDVLDLQNWARNNLKYIASIGGFLLVVLGTVGNGISMAVMRRERMKSAVAVTYLMALALTDTGLLWIGGGHWWINVTFDLSLRNLHTATCKLHLFLINFLNMLSAWIIVFVSVQRMLVVLLPYKAKQIATRKKSWVSLLVLILTLVAYNTYSLITAGLVKFTNSRGGTRSKCVYAINIEEFHEEYWRLISLLTTLILPFSTIFIANVVLIVKFIQSKVRGTLVTSQERSRSGQAKRITSTLISVSLIFLILNTPYVIVFYLLPLPTAQDRKYAIIFAILGQCATFLTTMNSAINVLLYCFTWPTFWTELRILMCEWCSCFRTNHSMGNHHGQHAPTEMTTVSLSVLS